MYSNMPHSGRLTRNEFEQALVAWVTSPEIKKAWQMTAELQAGWTWDWLLDRGHATPAVGNDISQDSKLFARLRVTRVHHLAADVLRDIQCQPAVDQRRENGEEWRQLCGDDDWGLEPHDPCAHEAATASCGARDTYDAAAAIAQRRVVVDWDVHIVYSDVYHTPVLFFNAAEASGRTISAWRQLRCLLPAGPFTGEEDHQGDDRREAVLSQDEHPVLGRPFYMLHPCETAACMAFMDPSLRALTAPHMSPGQCKAHVRGAAEVESSTTTTKASLPVSLATASAETPCDSSALVYLLRWFALTGPVVGLPPPAAFMTTMMTILCPS